jgi:hypothetical protein
MSQQHRTVILAFAVALTAAAASQTPAALQGAAVRQIPGLTAKDAFPNGCVDCHIDGKNGNLRMSALMAAWTKAVPAPLADKARASSVTASRIKGKHPPMANVKANIPQTCLAGCHKKGSTIAPPFAQLMHTVHLAGGSQNRYLTAYQGECMHCHKLDQKTGTWKMPTGPEK